MFIRYKAEDGKEIPVAKVYSQKEHPIRNSQIDKDTLWAIRKIHAHGAEAYVVGGAIRDLMLGKRPKDFDVATSLSPRQVAKIFWNARIIGKRFKIVHLYFSEDKIIEVTTFRSDEENFEEGNNNVFGSIEQDARRRDFSINSLYYNPENGQLLDFTGAMEDFRKRVIRSLIPLSYSFREDPVRMLRAIKYQVTTGFRFKLNVSFALRKYASYLSLVSTSRLTEEVMKILSSGYAKDIFLSLVKYKMLAYVLPCLSVYIKYDSMHKALSELDEDVRAKKKENNGLDRARMIYLIARPVIALKDIDQMKDDERMREVFREIKVFINPITPPNYEIERASALVLDDLGYKKERKRKEIIKKRENNLVMRKEGKKKVRRRRKPNPTPQSQQ